MAVNPEFVVRELIAAYLAGEISMEAFEDAFVEGTWDAEGRSLPSFQELVAMVELNLAEHSNGHLPEEQLRSALVEILNHPRLMPGSVEVLVTFGSGAVSISPTAVVGRSAEAVSG